MARKDLIHHAVKNALIKDGWTVTDDPLFVPIYTDSYLEIDLGAEKAVLATKKNKKIAVEIKSFSSGSITNAFHTVLGQYLDYKDALANINDDRVLYVGIDSIKYEEIQKHPFVLGQIDRYKIKLVIVNIKDEKISLWKK
jgi:hypothetical protein